MAVKLHACHNGDGDALSLTSQNGSIFVGQHGVYVPVFNVERIASHWGSKYLGPAGSEPGGTFHIFDFGGKQKTKIFGAVVQN